MRNRLASLVAVVGVTALTAAVLIPLLQSGEIKGESTITSKADKATQHPERQLKTLDTRVTQTAEFSASFEIDALVEAGYAKHGITPNALTSDETFVRRIYLDITGRIPTRKESDAFLQSDEADKRSQLIDRLLDSEGYVSHFYNFWADILRINNKLGNASSSAESAYNLWVKDALRSNLPYDQFVKDMVTAEGKIWENGAVGYYLRDRGMPLDNMSNTVRIFLGVRLECAQCHDHPFDEWTQMDYFKMAAFSHGMDNRRYETPNQKAFASGLRSDAVEKIAASFDIKGLDGNALQEVVKGRRSRTAERLGLSDKQVSKIRTKAKEAFEKAKAEGRQLRSVISDLYNPIRYISVNPDQDRALQLPHDYQYTDAKPFDPISPQTMFGGEIDPSKQDNLIAAYGDWMASPDNPTFTRVIANRLWKKVLGVGVFEPVDEIAEHTEISNPELMAYLEDLMKAEGYDMKAYLRALFNSKTYQGEAFAQEIAAGAPYHFPGPSLRRMSAEQVWDSLVSMVIPQADHYMPGVPGRLADIAKAKHVYDSLEEKSPEEFAAMVKSVSEAIDGVDSREQELRNKIIVARDAKDERTARQFQQEFRELVSQTKRTIAEIAYSSRSGKKQDTSSLLASAGMMEMSMMTGDENGTAVGIVTERRKLAAPAQEPPAGLSKTELRNWQREQKRVESLWQKVAGNLMRASELPSPAPRGHFLREFGQSDREVIENASDAASVPQSLALLNGTTTEILASPQSVIGNDMASAETPEEIIDRVYLTMLSRPALDREKALLISEFNKNPESAPETIIWALLNTQQFLFIQ